MRTPPARLSHFVLSPVKSIGSCPGFTTRKSIGSLFVHICFSLFIYRALLCALSTIGRCSCVNLCVCELNRRSVTSMVAGTFPVAAAVFEWELISSDAYERATS
ncbi:hypothetical protein BIW11_12993 [Tropilaelaps mercedesae]|uniref:Uncharacterized protein n=1 Tax=Tropilaelaps mercedesae TaxID=418985 RepID=A0A1V9X4H7_9ACAR|nr:hypothetical protein BIW11_12993 [Tropilaelaps mercedesae]